MNRQARCNRLHISVFEDRKEADRLTLAFEARRAYGHWLGSDFVWHHFATLTFAYDVTPEVACREFFAWVRSLERRGQRGVGWFYVIERGGAGRLHLHALLEGTAHLRAAELERTWRPGRADVSVYDPQQAGSYYISKDIGTRAIHSEISVPSRCARSES